MPDLVDEFYSLTSVYSSGSLTNTLILELDAALSIESEDDLFIKDVFFEDVLELWIQMPETSKVVDEIKTILSDSKELNFH